MPGFTYNLDATEMGDLVAFLESRSPNPIGSPSPESSAMRGYHGGTP